MLKLVSDINSLFWGLILIVLLVGTGLYFTIRLNFVQIRRFGKGLKQLTGDFSLSGEEAGKHGMSSFQALATAVAAQVGTGNLAGAATAIVSGGPGAIFWMWVSAFFGMATIYAEAILSQLFKKNVDGTVTGGPSYYIENMFNKNFLAKFLAIFFSVSCILALGFMGNGVQANSISVAFEHAFSIPPYITAIVIAILGAGVFFGGVKRIASFTEKVVPTMAIIYVIMCIIIIGINHNYVLMAFKAIFVNAFSSEAILGGVAGAGMKKAIRYGVARGLFSNEAGMGSTPHAHAVAKVKNPNAQGNLAIITVFIDTFIVLTLTALVILTSHVDFKDYTGIILTQKVFEGVCGYFGVVFVAISLFFFAFSTIIGWYFFGEANIRYLFGPKAINIYRICVMACIIFGSVQKVELVWELADMLNGFMVIPNLIALIYFHKLIKKASQN